MQHNVLPFLPPHSFIPILERGIKCRFYTPIRTCLQFKGLGLGLPPKALPTIDLTEGSQKRVSPELVGDQSQPNKKRRAPKKKPKIVELDDAKDEVELLKNAHHWKDRWVIQLITLPGEMQNTFNSPPKQVMSPIFFFKFSCIFCLSLCQKCQNLIEFNLKSLNPKPVICRILQYLNSVLRYTLYIYSKLSADCFLQQTAYNLYYTWYKYSLQTVYILYLPWGRLSADTLQSADCIYTWGRLSALLLQSADCMNTWADYILQSASNQQIVCNLHTVINTLYSKTVICPLYSVLCIPGLYFAPCFLKL